MITKNRVYKIKYRNFFLDIPSSLIILDLPWDNFDERDIEHYFKNGYNLFLKKVEKINQTKKHLNSEERKELLFMLEALLDAQSLRYDVKRRQSSQGK